jgi:HAE1 family hydrophobic/amphiphilic exporter-1
MKHTEFALRRPVTTVVTFVALALVGLIASRLLPLEKFPDIEFPGIFIQVPYPGSTPEEVERLITRPVEEALATLSGVETMFSSSEEGQAQIFLQFGWDQSMGAKGIEARAKVDSIRHQLPEDIRRIFIFTGSLGDQPVLQLRISSDRDLSDSYDLLDRLLKRRLERIEGVSRVELQGVDAREIRILLKPDRLARHGVDITSLRDLLLRSNFAVSAGKITAGDQRLSVRPRGEFNSVEEIRDIAINETGLRLRDIADVEMRTPDRNYGRHLDQKYAVGVAISKTTGAKQPGRQRQGFVVRFAQCRARWRIARNRRAVPVPAAGLDDTDRDCFSAVFDPHYAWRHVLLRPDAQHPVNDGPDARGRHARRQRRRHYRKCFSGTGRE